jgi:hypothetical protein
MSEIVLYQDDHLQGKTFVTQTEIPSLKAVGFQDITSSILVVSGRWRVYKDADFKGNSWEVQVDGGQYNRGVYLTPTDWGGNHDDISSIRPIG